MSDSATVFVVDDDAPYLASLARLLRVAGYSVEVFTSALDFLENRPVHARGCVVTDLHMPELDGIALQDALARTQNPLPIVFLTGVGDIPTSVSAIRRGAEDFLTKTAPKGELLDAIERALVRDAREHEERVRKHELEMRFANLTPREAEVLAHVLSGRMNKQIAADLGIDERSVKRHRSNLMTKLAVRSVAEIAQLVSDAGMRSRFRMPSGSAT